MDSLIAKPTVRILKDKFPEAIIEIDDTFGNLSISIKKEFLLDVCRELKENNELNYNLLLDVCGVDYLGIREIRFEVVYHFVSLSKKHRLRLKVPLLENELEIPSLVGIWKSANWFEREVFDMFGIKFKGHPKLRRILTHEEFKGHALRKDYDQGERHKLSKTYDAM